MRLLVTGSSGLLGTAVARELARRHAVVGFDRAAGPWTSHVGDVRDRDLVTHAMDGVDAVVHTASLHAPQVGHVSRSEFVGVNVEGTLRVLEAAAERRLRRVVFTSTTSLYGSALVPTDGAVWVTEDLPPRPRDVYDLTKLAAELLCEDIVRDGGPPTICLRTARFFPEPPDVVAVNRLGRGVDLRDAVAAHLLALTDDRVRFGVFNVSARSPFGRDELGELLVDAPAVIRRHYPWIDDAFAARGWRLPASIDRVYVVAKAEAMLGYRPAHDFASLFR